jgi:F-type H+-transporting ATPase subunit a
MADPVLHIKDSYFFEVPKVLYPYAYTSRKGFPRVWISLDPEFQDWEFNRLYDGLRALPEQHQVTLPPKAEAREAWHHWVHENHDNFARPFDEFLESKYQADLARFHAWKSNALREAQAKKDAAAEQAVRDKVFDDFLRFDDGAEHPYEEWSIKRSDLQFRDKWNALRKEAGKIEGEGGYNESDAPEWSEAKIKAYNVHLSGKIIIPQPFGELRNLHEAQSTLVNPVDEWGVNGFVNRDDFGFAISKFMVIEVAVGLVLFLLFTWLARRLTAGGPPRGALWNLLETFVLFIRDQVAAPALGGHHEEGHGDHGGHDHGGHDHGGHEHGAHQHEKVDHAHDEFRHGSPDLAHAPAAPVHVTAHGHDHGDPVKTYTPLLCTIFFFILGCNLAGMLPWVGAPTGTWGVTLAMAFVTFAAVTIGGMRQFGFFGFFLNQLPSMDLAWYMALFLKPAIWVIEMVGLLIKHAVLSVRLLANMLAGHMVLLAIMGLAFGVPAGVAFIQPDGTVSFMWWVAAICSVVGCALLSMLELFVAFLQAYVFTLLSALFIGAAIHKH